MKKIVSSIAVFSFIFCVTGMAQQAPGTSQTTGKKKISVTAKTSIKPSCVSEPIPILREQEVKQPTSTATTKTEVQTGSLKQVPVNNNSMEQTPVKTEIKKNN